MSEVVNRLKGQPDAPGSSNWRCPKNDGACTRAKPCRPCLGARNRRKGLRKQREARKALGVAPSNKFGDANEERWGDHLFANEVKAGKQIGPAVTAWTRIEKQVRSNEPDVGGMHKPVRAVLMPDGWAKGEGIVMVRLSTWHELVLPALDECYGAAS